MAIVSTIENPRERGGSGAKGDGSSWNRSWIVRVDSLAESLVAVRDSTGVAEGSLHPDDGSTVADSWDIKVADGAGLAYSVTWKYKKATADNEENNDQPGGLDGKPPIWGGTSGVTTGPVYKDKNGQMMTNSAGDPLEGLEKEFADEKLTLTQYYLSHNTWMPLSREYTNAINNAGWNGGQPRTWKCQGCSKKLNIENNDSITLVYWEVTWEFAYRKDGWVLRPWDIGFAQLVGDDGVPSLAAAKNRAQIKGQDGKPVRQPVALQNGIAKPAGQPPDELEFFVYEELDFMAPFGEVFTPGGL